MLHDVIHFVHAQAKISTVAAGSMHKWSGSHLATAKVKVHTIGSLWIGLQLKILVFVQRERAFPDMSQ